MRPFSLCVTVSLILFSTIASAQVVINEVDYDQAGTDAAEFVELKNNGSAPVDLSAFTLELVNGTSGGAFIYNTIALPGVTLPAGGYYVVCANAATVANCDLDATPDTNFIQNGAPDAVGLREASVLVDAVSYEGDTGAPYTEGSGAGLEDISSVDSASISRFPDGIDTNVNNVDFSLRCATPGGPNSASSTNCSTPNIVINEVDADTPGIDSEEFIELFGGPFAPLDGIVLVLFNGNGDVSYNAFDLDGFTTDADGFFLLGNSAVSGVQITFPGNGLQNGADAVALYQGDATDFPNGTPVTSANLIDAIVYDTNDADDPDLLAILTPGQAQINEGGAGDKDNHSNSRVPDGGASLDTSTYVQQQPTPGETNVLPPPPVIGLCGDPATFIHSIQGNGFVSPLVGMSQVIEGVVIGDFQGSAALGGFFVQEEDSDADGDPMTSEGIFVFDGAFFPVDVAPGDVVRVGGTVDEFFGLTELTSVTGVSVCSPGAGGASASALTLPLAAVGDLEAFEGMLVQFPQTLVATDNFNQGRFGEVTLSAGDRLRIPTHVASPGAPALAVQDLNTRSQILLDDGSNIQNPLPLPPYLGVDDTLRDGDTTTNLVGALSYGFGVYRVHPTQSVAFARVNDRPDVPDVGGTVKVASFNVLNYFTTLDTGAPICGPSGDLDCRGAEDAFEFTRQREKILAALTELDADIVGLAELENNATAAIQDLVDGLNTLVGPGTYEFINTGTIGTDAIKVALIYKPATVDPVGAYAILDSSVDPLFIDTRNRPSLAQTFQENATGSKFTVVVNHLKSKGSACDDIGDPDTGDGQGNCNVTRTNAATALVNWLATDPTGSGDPDFLIMGDLNAYAMEDPISAVKGAGYTDLVNAYSGASAYSFVFFGEAGYLDHALSSPNLTSQVTGVSEWHINADEPRALDYNDFNQPALYNPDEFRSSDHDPIVVGLDLVAPPDCSMAVPSLTTLWPPNHQFVPIDILGVTDPNELPVTITIDSVFQDEPVNGDGDGDTSPDATGIGTATAEVRAERSGSGNGRVYHISFTADNGVGGTCSGVVRVGAPKSQGRNGGPVDGGPLYDSTVP